MKINSNVSYVWRRNVIFIVYDLKAVRILCCKKQRMFLYIYIYIYVCVCVCVCDLMMFTYLIVRKTHKFSNFLFNMPLGLTSVYLVAKFHHLVTKKMEL